MKQLMAFTVQGEPSGWKRPRPKKHRQAGRRGYYSPGEKDRQALAWEMKIRLRQADRHGIREFPAADVRFGLMVAFVQKDGPTVKDADNLLKQVMEAGEGVIWENDRQVKFVTVRVAETKDRQGAQTLIGIFLLEGEQWPTVTTEMRR